MKRIVIHCLHLRSKKRRNFFLGFQTTLRLLTNRDIRYFSQIISIFSVNFLIPFFKQI